MQWGKTVSNNFKLYLDELVADQITTVNLDATNIESLTLVTTTLTADVINTDTIDATEISTFEKGIKTSTGGAVFKYAKGSWVPTVNILVASGFVAADILYNYQYGTYIRNGAMITLFFDVKFSIQNTGADKFVTIGGLPFKISNDANGETQSTETLTTSSFPNGFGGPVPAIGFPTYPEPYSVSAYELGTLVNLNIDYPPVPVSYGDWTADGYHLVLYSDNTLFTAVVGVPPFAEAATTNGTLSTFHVSSLGYNTGCRFAGSISYFTDQ